MNKITIPVKALQRVRQAAKETRSRSAEVYMTTGSIIFLVGEKSEQQTFQIQELNAKI